VIPKGLIDELKRWMKDGLYGHIQINFRDGKIMSLNRVQTINIDDFTNLELASSSNMNT